MTMVDNMYNDLNLKIKNEGSWDKGKDVRGTYKDGSPAYSKELFGVQVEFPKGTIPILTNKKVFWKTALKEMQLFWVHQTVNQDDFEKLSVKVWNEWFNEQRNLGRSYAYQFESHRHHHREIIKVKPITKDHHGELSSIVIGEKEEPNKNNNDENVGKIFESNSFGKFIVLDAFPSGTHFEKIQSFKIQFIGTNSIKIVRKYDALKGEVQDNFVRNVRGVGYLGNHKSVKNYKEKEIKKLYNVWENMISRCYVSDPHGRYKSNGVFVDERWHSFENFLRDIRYIPQFFLAKEKEFKGWSIDKDYYGSNCYSKETCVWLTESENKIYRNQNKPFYMIDNEGNKKTFISIKDCGFELGLANGSSISGCLNKNPNRKTVKGYKFEYINDKEYLYRYELSRNQVVELIQNIKTNPSSKRLMTSFWNYADVNKKVLQECAWASDWNVNNNDLELILIQRSADIGLGVVFNWIQYYFLQCQIAHVTGLEVGKFVHQIGSLHYYDRHEEELIKQTENETYEPPKLWINEEVKDFFDFTPEDIKLIDYQSGEFIYMEVAI